MMMNSESNSLARCNEFRCHNRRVFRPGVSHLAQDCGLPETSGSELIEECACILGSRYSRKPIGAAGLKVLRQSRFEDQFGSEHLTSRT